jgi:hypothetical protein
MTVTNTNTEADVKLYAGKFNTVEELEIGYKNSLPTFQENEQLKAKLEEQTKVPDTYQNPSDIELEANRVADIQARAKASGMTQSQYEKFVRDDKARVDAHQSAFEASRKEVGEETINLLKDYVSKNYPKELQDTMVNTFIGNKEARQAALNHRAQLLNSTVPGMQKTGAYSYAVTEDDIKKAYVAKEKNPADIKARNHYLNLLAAQAAQKTG